MPTLAFSDPDTARERQKWANEFPGALFGYLGDLQQGLVGEFEKAIGSRDEENIQKLLTQNPYLIQYAIDRSGHHGIWVFPKQMIRPPAANRGKGMIPDYLVATRSSLGYFWHIIELKRADAQFCNSKGNGYSGEAQKALAQCNRYLAHMQDYIETVRTNVRVNDIVQPMGAVVLIGDAMSETPEQRRCRAEFVRNNPRTSIVSYDRIRRGLANDVRGTTST
jgi:hypothetical protein